MSVISCSVPLIGFAAYSGTGKTTLLEKILPLLVNKNIRIGLVKASHHDIDPDMPGKDSYRLRRAGSVQLVLSTPNRSICYTERKSEAEPTLSEQLQLLNLEQLDLVVVEGFRDESFPKIELRRQGISRPSLHLNDEHIIAVASDDKRALQGCSIPVLDINNPEQIADYICEHIL